MIGERLKKIRVAKKISMDTVYKKTGITDSRLSKIERGIIKHPTLDDIDAVLKLYDVPLFSVLCDEGYCEKNTYVFKNIEYLNSLELKHIQEEIDFILEEKGMKNDI